MGFKGIAKKVCIFVLVGIANILDTQVLQNGTAICTAVIFFYLANEGISILENSAAIGIPIPAKLRDMLIQLSDEKKLPGKDKKEKKRRANNASPFTNLTYGVDGCNEPMFRIGYNTPLYTYTDERSAKAEP